MPLTPTEVGPTETEPARSPRPRSERRQRREPQVVRAVAPREGGALEREGDIAADYLEEFLDIADLDGDIDMDVEGDRAAVSIVGAGLFPARGGEGEVLDALQEPRVWPCGARPASAPG